jgi:hypothetical protein
MLDEALDEFLGPSAPTKEFVRDLICSLQGESYSSPLELTSVEHEVERLFRLRITLQGCTPPIWRLIEVPDCSLGELHHLLQEAMGWENSHLYQFEVTKRRYTDLDFELGDDDRDAWQCWLSDIIPVSRRKVRFTYTYDFGDGWEHEIVCEGSRPGTIDDQPICLGGERACPPEDVGGPWGYANMLHALADPRHENHDEIVEWIGSYDADAFEVEKCSVALKGCWQELLDPSNEDDEEREY